MSPGKLSSPVLLFLVVCFEARNFGKQSTSFDMTFSSFQASNRPVLGARTLHNSVVCKIESCNLFFEDTSNEGGFNKEDNPSFLTRARILLGCIESSILTKRTLDRLHKIEISSAWLDDVVVNDCFVDLQEIAVSP
uniref:Uncharacterized protein n=1 Tax=Tanacetum cinerariifolium TaxID=118510 RepID=A0A699JTS8_TANCI|nr:hypothetical protein [Tanacetum cinerariifolium]